MDDEEFGEWMRRPWHDHWFFELVVVPAIAAIIASIIGSIIIAIF